MKSPGVREGKVVSRDMSSDRSWTYPLANMPGRKKAGQSFVSPALPVWMWTLEFCQGGSEAWRCYAREHIPLILF